MNYRRAIIAALILYVLGLIVGVLIAKLLNIDVQSGGTLTLAFSLISIIAVIVLTGLAAFWYFRVEAASIQEGLLLGVVIFVIGSALDLILFIVYFRSQTAIDVAAYYTNPFLWIAAASIFATTAGVGYWKSKK